MNSTVKWVLGGVVLAAVAAFAYWTISPFFRNIKVDEALPTATTTPQMASEVPVAEKMPPAAEPQTTAAAEVVGTAGHPASGTARLVEAGGKTYVRYENFKTLNGPDIYVYLAKDKDAKEFVDLGRVKATEGNINYEVPAGVDVSQYSYVLTWCKAFGVLFNSAKVL